MLSMLIILAIILNRGDNNILDEYFFRIILCVEIFF